MQNLQDPVIEPGKNNPKEIQVIHERPPNFDAIAEKFPMAHNPGVIFAYGDIYNPSGQALPEPLWEHEKVHCQRQREIGVEKWWDKYLEDPDFRYQEELLAHRAEYQAVVKKCRSRQQRRRALRHVAKKLSAPLYGRMVSLDKAKQDIKNDK